MSYLITHDSTLIQFTSAQTHGDLQTASREMAGYAIHHKGQKVDWEIHLSPTCDRPRWVSFQREGGTWFRDLGHLGLTRADRQEWLESLVA